MKKKSKIVLVSTLILIELVSVFLMYKSSLNNIVKLEEVSLKEEEISSEIFAVMLEQTDGTYTESDAFPTGNYIYDSEKSGCMDINGDKIDGVLTYDQTTNTATVDTGKTSYCYLYFNNMNINGMCKNYDNLGACMASEYDNNLTKIANLSTSDVGGMRRYQGDRNAVNNNYFCFGTKNVNECVNNQDQYMYRIIGVQSDGKIKLIKKEALNNSYAWMVSGNYNPIWIESDLYKGLNAIDGGAYNNIFINSSEYSYMNIDGEWYNKIYSNNWKYGLVKKNGAITADEWYAFENSFEQTVNSKIGLMYVHDYNYSGPNTSNGLKWIYISNNDPDAEQIPRWYEWTMTYSDKQSPWYIVSITGMLFVDTDRTAGAVRPVFYLNSDLSITGGTGKIDNPYIIS